MITIKTLEELRGDIPQNKVAEKLGISKSHMSLLENGKRRMYLDVAEKLSNIYGVSVDVILSAYNVCRKSTLRDSAHKTTGTDSKPTGTTG